MGLHISVLLGQVGYTCLAVVLCAWPIGALRGQPSLTWAQRLGRIGAASSLMVIGIYLGERAGLIPATLTTVHLQQVFAVLGAVSLLPATATLGPRCAEETIGHRKQRICWWFSGRSSF